MTSKTAQNTSASKRRYFNKHEYKGSTGRIMSQKSITVPDMALTAREIIDFHTRSAGQHIKPDPSQYETDVQITSAFKMTRQEKEQYLIDNAQLIAQQQDTLKAEQQEAVEKAEQQRIEREAAIEAAKQKAIEDAVAAMKKQNT